MPTFLQYESFSLLSSSVLDGRLAGAVPLLLPMPNETDGAVAFLTNAFLRTLATIIVDSTPVFAARLPGVHNVVSQHAANVAIFGDVVFDAHALSGGKRSHANDQKK